jgi:hypothetical protein
MNSIGIIQCDSDRFKTVQILLDWTGVKIKTQSNI